MQATVINLSSLLSYDQQCDLKAKQPVLIISLQGCTND